jgi:hypothetical protein
MDNLNATILTAMSAKDIAKSAKGMTQRRKDISLCGIYQFLQPATCYQQQVTCNL